MEPSSVWRKLLITGRPLHPPSSAARMSSSCTKGQSRYRKLNCNDLHVLNSSFSNGQQLLPMTIQTLYWSPTRLYKYHWLGLPISSGLNYLDSPELSPNFPQLCSVSLISTCHGFQGKKASAHVQHTAHRCRFFHTFTNPTTCWHILAHLHKSAYTSRLNALIHNFHGSERSVHLSYLMLSKSTPLFRT